MNTTVPWSIKDVSDDTREAAQEAARRSGQSLGDWLDGVIAEQSAKRKDSRSDHRAEMEAIAAQLARFSTEPARDTGRDLRPSEYGAAIDPHSSARADVPVFDPKAAIRNAVAEIARRQADLDGVDGLRPSPPPQRDHMRSGLMAGTTLSDRPGAQSSPTTSEGFPAGLEGPRKRSGSRQESASLSSEVAQTFAQFTRDLQDAIHASDVRPQVDDLDRQLRRMGRTVEGISAGLPSSDALARISEQTREVRNLLTSAAERSPSLTAAEGQVAKLEARLGALASAPPTPPARTRRHLGRSSCAARQLQARRRLFVARTTHRRPDTAHRARGRGRHVDAVDRGPEPPRRRNPHVATLATRRCRR